MHVSSPSPLGHPARWNHFRAGDHLWCRHMTACGLGMMQSTPALGPQDQSPRQHSPCPPCLPRPRLWKPAALPPAPPRATSRYLDLPGCSLVPIALPGWWADVGSACSTCMSTVMAPWSLYSAWSGANHLWNVRSKVCCLLYVLFRLTFCCCVGRRKDERCRANQQKCAQHCRCCWGVTRAVQEACCRSHQLWQAAATKAAVIA